MSKIAEAFQGKKAFIAYLMAGDPDLATSAEYILAAQEAGADLIEIGIPFSDPIAEGEVIQQAGIRALKAGARLDRIFEMVTSLQGKIRAPIVFMTYLNPVFVYGYDRFFKKCRDIGVCGIIIPDLPFEQQQEAADPAAEYGIEVIALVAPTSSERISRIAKDAKGFIYLVSSLGVTGVRNEIKTDIRARVEELRAVTSLPIAVGFGISTPEQAAEYSQYADGVIVGSAIVSLIGEYGGKARGPLKEYIANMKAALR
ncbi:MAG: tryptophan synthase subunit alpha [Syntrophomonadaceae bacterium]|nr:tryptophan synthase subunit alpha [Syntrophomonadaceae bacterium]